MTIGSVIRRLREERNVTQEHMAKELNIGITAYGNIERNDVKRLTLDRLKEIAFILKVHVFELFGVGEKDLFFKDKKWASDVFNDVNMLAVLQYFRKDKEMLHNSLGILKAICDEFRQQMQENNAMLIKLMDMLLELHQNRGRIGRS